jgi:hypothetical protein
MTFKPWTGRFFGLLFCGAMERKPVKQMAHFVADRCRCLVCTEIRGDDNQRGSLPASAFQNGRYVQTSEHQKRKSLKAVYFGAII